MDVNWEMLSEIKKQGDIMAVQLSYQGKEIEELKDGLRDASDARQRIYERCTRNDSSPTFEMTFDATVCVEGSNITQSTRKNIPVREKR